MTTRPARGTATAMMSLRSVVRLDEDGEEVELLTGSFGPLLGGSLALHVSNPMQV